MFVAPYVGAWIETLKSGIASGLGDVAPYVGAWIETKFLLCFACILGVAPYVGAWIETTIPTTLRTNPASSLPTWERGLKPKLPVTPK